MRRRTASASPCLDAIPPVTISPPHGNPTNALGIAASLVLIAAATLDVEWGAPASDIHPLCVLCGDLGGPDLVLNVLLFLPLGFFLARAGWPWRRLLLAGVLLSAGIEVAQVWLPGRSSTLRDVLSNAAGVGAGALVAFHGARAIAPGRWAPARLWGVTLGALAVVALTGWSVRFAPSGTPYYAHWSPRQQHLEPWTGRVLHASIDGRALPPGRVVDAEALRAAVRDGVDLRIDAVGGAPTRELGGIVTISDARMREVLLVGPVGDDLVVRVRRNAARLRFDAPEERFRGLLASVGPATPLSIRVSATPGRTCATVNGRTACGAPPSAGSAWRLLRSFGWGSLRARILLDALTLAALAVLVGLQVRAVSIAQSGAASLTLVAGTWLVARVTGLSAPRPAEWAGLLAGLVAGVLVSRHLSREAAAGGRPVA